MTLITWVQQDRIKSKKRENMPNQAERDEFIAERNWGGFFDGLDVDESGTLSHREFWKWTETRSCDVIIKDLTSNLSRVDFLKSLK